MAVVGVDACKNGWVGIVLGDDGSVLGLHAADIVMLESRANSLAELTVVAVDMPVGLADLGTRKSDVLARSMVGARRSSVFMTPVRAALHETTHAAASRRSRELGNGGVSQQAFALRPRLLEVDRWVPLAAAPVIEVHPEVSFAALAGAPLRYGKKSWAGTALRRDLLARAGIVLDNDLGEVGELAAVDDVLDAAVGAWSALRYAAGTARSYPDPPEIFSDGLASAIWA